MNDFGYETYWASSEIGYDFWIAKGGPWVRCLDSAPMDVTRWMISPATMPLTTAGY